jgi:hypothetical protein
MEQRHLQIQVARLKSNKILSLNSSHSLTFFITFQTQPITETIYTTKQFCAHAGLYRTGNSSRKKTLLCKFPHNVDIQNFPIDTLCRTTILKKIKSIILYLFIHPVTVQNSIHLPLLPIGSVYIV